MALVVPNFGAVLAVGDDEGHALEHHGLAAVVQGWAGAVEVEHFQAPNQIEH